jgi:hypothetical protein
LSQLLRVRAIPLWLIAILLISGTGTGILAYYIWNTLVIPLEVKEPLEILSYPSELSLFPGETEEFNITVQNHASVDYNVTLGFSLNNTAYQSDYVTFSNELYNVIPGQQILSAWLIVESYAPPANSSLAINITREPPRTFTPTEQFSILSVSFGGTSDTANNTISLIVKNIGTGDVTISQAKVDNVAKTFSATTSTTIQPGDQETFTVYMGTDSWTSGNKYDINLITSTGIQFLYKSTAP